MSTPIRPPTGPLPAGVAGLEGTGPAGGVEGADQVASTDRTSTQAVDRGGALAGATAAEAESPTASVLGRLEAGEVSREQAIEMLVGQALEAHGGAALSAPQRAELEGVLRSALLDDPTLSRLLG